MCLMLLVMTISKMLHNTELVMYHQKLLYHLRPTECHSMPRHYIAVIYLYLLRLLSVSIQR